LSYGFPVLVEFLVFENAVQKLLIKERTVLNNFGPILDSIIKTHALSIFV